MASIDHLGDAVPGVDFEDFFSDEVHLIVNDGDLDDDPFDLNELPEDEEDEEADREEEEDDDDEEAEGEKIDVKSVEFSSDSDQSKLPSCPICFKPWTSDGPHRVCCFPCGHIYGRSCLEKWLQRCGGTSGKCPQCNRKFRLKQIINLYAPVIAIPNDSLEKESDCIHEKNESLRLEVHELPSEQTSGPSNLLRQTFEDQRNGCTRCSELQERVTNLESNIMARVEVLEAQFSQLTEMRNEVVELRNEMAEKVADLQRKLAELKSNMDEKTEDLQSKVIELRREMDEIKSEMTEVRRIFDEARRMQDELQISKKRRPNNSG